MITIPRPARAGLALTTVACLSVAACSSSDDSTNAETTPDPATSEQDTADDDPPDDAASDDASPENLLLDYTLYIEGAIQVSGIAASPDVTALAVVTDFEKVIVYDIEEQAVASEFNVQLGDLPVQGATEAIAYTASDELAVYYPNAPLVRLYSLTGDLIDEIEIDAGDVKADFAGAMTVMEDGSFVLATEDPDPVLVRVGRDGSVEATADLVTDAPVAEVVGLSQADGDAVYIATEDGEILRADLESGTAELLPPVSEVGEPSDIEFFTAPDDEDVLAITDDANEFNDTEGPIRLYVVP